MSFAQPSPSIDIKRIIRFGRILSHGYGSSMSELIAGANNEIIKSVIRIQIWIQEHSVFGLSLLRRAPLEGGGVFINNVSDVIDFIEKLLGTTAYQTGIVKRQPVFEVGIGDFHIKNIAFLPDENGRLKPGFVAILVYLFLQGRNDF
jgi:hypothetical protein